MFTSSIQESLNNFTQLIIEKALTKFNGAVDISSLKITYDKETRLITIQIKLEGD